MPQCVTRPRTSDLTKRLGLKVEPISAPVSGDVTGRAAAIRRDNSNAQQNPLE
jgi:hypothetical protein